MVVSRCLRSPDSPKVPSANLEAPLMPGNPRDDAPAYIVTHAVQNTDGKKTNQGSPPHLYPPPYLPPGSSIIGEDTV